MLDVHPPHEKIHGFGDFLLHVLTMTVGLFIALALEGCVERHHKAEVRREAESDLRRETEDNRKKLTEWNVDIAREEVNVKLALDFVFAKLDGHAADPSHINLGFSIRNLSDASWRTASATGALSFMDYGQVQQYASVYQVQDQVMDLEKTALDDFLIVQSRILYHFDPDKITAEQAHEAESELRRALAHLEAMQQVASGLGRRYDDLLKGSSK